MTAGTTFSARVWLTGISCNDSTQELCCKHLNIFVVTFKHLSSILSRECIAVLRIQAHLHRFSPRTRASVCFFSLGNLSKFVSLDRLHWFASEFAASCEWLCMYTQQWILKHDNNVFNKKCRSQLLFTKKCWQLKLFALDLATFCKWFFSRRALGEYLASSRYWCRRLP